MGKLRVEETPPKPTLVVGRVELPKQGAMIRDPVAIRETLDAEHWRKLALATADRLQHAENQGNDLRQTATELRARLVKANDRLDRANERVNELQVQLVRVTAERDRLRDSGDAERLRALVGRHEEIARKVHQYRESLLTGPLWALFEELVSGPLLAGEEKAS